jgi:MoaA/NifB/PqqE/SkfB family radical SAM enzyme
MKRSLIVDTHASSCYFRTSVEGESRKALVQITERCNLHCAHCFVSSGKSGIDIPFTDIAGKVLPRLRQARVERITLTGGEPLRSSTPGPASASLASTCRVEIAA